MPSGAKKRKAAKKKKEQPASSSNNNSNSSSLQSLDLPGNDDLKSQDERDSDSGEVSSHVAHDHKKDHHHFGRGNEGPDKAAPSPVHEGPDKAAPSPVQSAFPENVMGVPGNARGKEVGQEDDDMVRTERELKSKQDSDSNIVIEHTKESYGGYERSSSSSSSSSDEDSEAVEKKWKAQDSRVGSLTEQLTQISENGKPVKDDSAVETAPDAVLNEPPVPMSEVVKNAAQSSQVESPEVLEVVESEFKANEVKLPASNDATETSTAIIAPGKDEDQAFPVSYEKPSDVASVTMLGSDDKVFTSSDAHPSKALNNDTNIKYSDTSESTENQPLIASTPRVSQRTSWMSCCGLFDAFTGSGR